MRKLATTSHDTRTASQRLPWDRRREQLLAAAERVIARDGPQVSMHAVAAEAGVSKPIVYRHFGDKNGLAHAVGVRYATELLTAIRSALLSHADPFERTAATIDAFVQHVEETLPTYRFLTRGSAEGAPAVGDAVDTFVRLVGDELAAFMIADDPDQSPQRQPLLLTWGHAIAGMARAALDLWLDRRHVARDELVRHLADLLWNGIESATGRTSAPPS